MTRLPDAQGLSVDQEFETWERLRQQLIEREGRWAAAVTTSADTLRLAALQREMAELRQALDEVFGRAMHALEQAGSVAMTQ